MGSVILFIFTNGTLFPVTSYILAPIAIAMGGGSCSSADIAVLVTAVTIGMRSELGNWFCFGYITGGAGKGLVQGAYTNYYQDSAMVQLLAHNQIGRDTVEEAYNNNRVLYVSVTDNTSSPPRTEKRIPVTIEAHINADARVTGYTVWGWYSKTQTITWEIDDTVNSVWGTIE
jgi:hypothetical protein